MSILCDHIVLFFVLEVLSQEREVGSRLGAGSKGTPETLACLLENSYGRPFIVDQPHLKKCSRKLFDSILC